MLACEILVVAATAYPTAAGLSILQTLCRRNPVPDVNALVSLNTMFAAGATVLALGSLGRVWYYRTLGQMYTYELAIRPNHVLATTGPYAFLRHPGYTAGMLVMFAFPAVHLAPGSWARECEVSSSTSWRWLMGAFTVAVSWITFGLWKRGPVEDAKMREHFGKKWMEYRGRVRWGYVPFVLRSSKVDAITDMGCFNDVVNSWLKRDGR
jgi:protein-S-isoprenylcysteine O-methyltransferase Ste14